MQTATSFGATFDKRVLLRVYCRGTGNVAAKKLFREQIPEREKPAGDSRTGLCGLNPKSTATVGGGLLPGRTVEPSPAPGKGSMSQGGGKRHVSTSRNSSRRQE
jgi:hypothetical protein